MEAAPSQLQSQYLSALFAAYDAHEELELLRTIPTIFYEEAVQPILIANDQRAL